MITCSHPRRSRKEVRLGKNPDVVYFEEDRIGQGQFGTVYRGHCPATGAVVAVKLLRDLPSAGTSEVASPHRTTDTAHDEKEHNSTVSATTTKPRPRFPSELELLWALRGDNCPNIVHVLSVWSKTCKHRSNNATTTAAAIPTSGERSNSNSEVGGRHPPSPSVPSSATATTTNTEARERHSNVYVLVTEYCEGGDLQHRLQALDANVPTHVARSFTYQLCNALYTLKRRRIVHRDIKPANLLLSSRAWESATLKVADFGMAKAAPAPKTANKVGCRISGAAGTEDEGKVGVCTDDAELLHDDDDDANTLSSTLFYSEMGTPMYMSPERIAGQPYDYKADVYSAGMVLLEMMRGACVRVTRVSQLRTMVPETIQRLCTRYAARGECVPAWLDLVQKMTATDPAQRYSAEDALRHSWFAEPVEPPLPRLTFELPPETEGMVDKASAAVVIGVSDVGDVKPTDPAKSEKAGAAYAVSAYGITPTGQENSNISPATADTEEYGKRSTDSFSTALPPATSVAATGEGEATANAAAEYITTDPLAPSQSEDGAGEGVTTPAPAGGGCRRQDPPSHWLLLGVCAQIERQHNIARCIYTGPLPKSRHGGSALTTFITAAGTNTTASGATAVFTLPAACGPHVITHAVRGFVDAVYLYVLQDELDPVGGMTLVSFLVELVQNGFAAYLECLESLNGLSGTSATVSTTATTESERDSRTQSNNNNSRMVGNTGVCINGTRFIVKDVGALPEVWQSLMVRLSRAQAVYKAQLPPRMLQSAALWRQRMLMATLNTNTPCSAAMVGWGDNALNRTVGVEDSRLYGASSSSSSEGEAAMPDLPNVASITNVSGAEGCDATSSTATTNTTGAPTQNAALAKPPLSVYTLSTRAEQLIFAKAVDCIQSEALALWISGLPHDHPGKHERNNDLTAMDCWEEGAEESRLPRVREAPAPPRLPERRPSTSAETTTASATADPPAATPAAGAMPPHRGIALLRVLLQRAVLSATEVGLESEAAAAGRDTWLGPSMALPTADACGDRVNCSSTPPARTPSQPSTASAHAAASTMEAGGYTFVVQVPVYATLQPVDVRIVEKLLCAATRVFTSSYRSA